jgi:hypothetical protein
MENATNVFIYPTSHSNLYMALLGISLNYYT